MITFRHTFFVYDYDISSSETKIVRLLLFSYHKARFDSRLQHNPTTLELGPLAEEFGAVWKARLPFDYASVALEAVGMADGVEATLVPG
jgi:hypothetical protein